MRSGLRWYDTIFVLVFFYLLVLQIQAIWPFTIDDMYISLRYARNWASGDGLLWNLDSPPVEGYSNFSFVVLGALSLVFNGNPIVTLKTAGFIGLVGTCCFLFLISRFWFTIRESLIPCIILLVYKGQIIWAVSGFETTVYQALICGSVYFIFRGQGYDLYPGGRGELRTFSFFIAGILLALAGMTRPEAPAFMILFFILICWDRPQTSLHRHRKGVLYFFVSLVLFYLPYFLWRWHYYGFLFPNSVYCKGFTEGFLYELDLNYLKLIWPFVILALPAFIKAWDKRYFFLCLPSLAYLIMLRDADPIVAFDNRLFLPAFTLFIPLAYKGLDQLNLSLFKKKETFTTFALYLVICAVLTLFLPWMSLAQYRYFSENPVRGEQLRMSVIQWLNANARIDDRVVLGDSGMIPYLSKLHFIDSYCLNNLSMTQYPGQQRYDQFCHQILFERPEIIILTSFIKDGQVFYAPSDACLKAVLDNQTDYKLTRSFTAENPDSEYRYEMFTNF
ncbi:protein LphB [Legionella bononiensis]|uniref:Protein LphB n=1 Tax=Legionella bononiensis TaxID=2793102 RepID=A0ABS1W8L9_9GAMM|nr:protein LphB [Legionella bononiensis]MBL7479785.1 protein LphB [Legionella bononiensis]MBL7525701.1 protein LphB [Legionella bononiensis]MBL7561884.1 protein LphB [Legionella bononiensis]